MKLLPEEIRLALKTIGRIKSPNYKLITERLTARDDFRSDIQQSQIEEIHDIALTVGDIDEAIRILTESGGSASSVKNLNDSETPSDDFKGVKKIAKTQKRKDGEMSGSSKKIVEYRVVRKKFEGELINEVNKYIETGWVPLGGVAYAAAGMTPLGDTGNTFIQAIVRYK